MKKLFVAILILLSCCAIFCLQQKNRTTGSMKLFFWTLQMGDFSNYMNGVINDFEKQNPEIKIKWVDVPFLKGKNAHLRQFSATLRRI